MSRRRRTRCQIGHDARARSRAPQTRDRGAVGGPRVRRTVVLTAPVGARRLCRGDAGRGVRSDMTLERDLAHHKPGIEARWADLVYDGQWFSPLRSALDAYVEATQDAVSDRT